MPTTRVYLAVSTAEYARAYGISERTARRRLTESGNTFRVGTRLKTLVPATDYARRTGRSVSSVRRDRAAVRTDNVRSVLPGLTKPTRKQRIAEARTLALLGRTSVVSPATVENRVQKMTSSQLRQVEADPALTYSDTDNPDEWDTLLQYH